MNDEPCCPECQAIGYSVIYYYDGGYEGRCCAVCNAEYEVDMMDDEVDDVDDSMDGDHASALASAGFGTDEDYGGGCDSGDCW